MHHRPMTPPPPAQDDPHAASVPDVALALWREGQDVADRLDRAAEQQHDEDERERLGDLADALRGL